jgi:hypothetical protein
MKRYCEDNKEKIKEKGKQYREDNKDRKQTYMKQYREDNKEKIQEYKEDNREKTREYFKEKVTCKCGCEVNKNSLKRHERNKKHTDLMNKLK